MVNIEKFLYKQKITLCLKHFSKTRIKYLWITCKMAYRNLYALLRCTSMLLIGVSDN